MITFDITVLLCAIRPSCERGALLDLYQPADKDTYYHTNVYLTSSGKKTSSETIQ